MRPVRPVRAQPFPAMRTKFLIAIKGASHMVTMIPTSGGVPAPTGGRSDGPAARGTT